MYLTTGYLVQWHGSWGLVSFQVLPHVLGAGSLQYGQLSDTLLAADEPDSAQSRLAIGSEGLACTGREVLVAMAAGTCSAGAEPAAGAEPEPAKPSIHPNLIDTQTGRTCQISIIHANLKQRQVLYSIQVLVLKTAVFARNNCPILSSTTDDSAHLPTPPFTNWVSVKSANVTLNIA